MTFEKLKKYSIVDYGIFCIPSSSFSLTNALNINAVQYGLQLQNVIEATIQFKFQKFVPSELTKTKTKFFVITSLKGAEKGSFA